MRLLIFLVLLATVLRSQSLNIKKGLKNDPAQPCDASACLLPDCFCSTTTPPMDPADMPQIVMLSFDDDLSAEFYNSFYASLMTHKNRNGCPIGVTFFLAHDYTDYTLVNKVWNGGAEIASHSISHQTPTTYWATLSYQGWIDEMVGLTQIASTFANISISDIIGARAPFLQIEGDVMMQALYDSGFHYESSMPSQDYEIPPLFPYTFDYKSIQDCEITPCPVDSYPGFWEMPMIDYNDTQNIPCSMLDGCPSTNTTDATYQFLLYNFNNHYTTNKAPYGLYTHASYFLTDPSHYPGYVQFVEYVLTLPDVYIVTVKQAIEWMQNPTPLSDIDNFEPWFCNDLPNNGCSPKTDCYYEDTTPGGSRYMMVCGSCPPNYPWVGNPYGH